MQSRCNVNRKRFSHTDGSLDAKMHLLVVRLTGSCVHFSVLEFWTVDGTKTSPLGDFIDFQLSSFGSYLGSIYNQTGKRN